MDFRLLGPVGVEAGGRELTPRRARERAVLALLLLRQPAAIGVEELIDAVWGEHPPPTARTALQGLIAALRRGLGAERIETASHGYRLRLLPGDDLDLASFDALAADASGAPPAVRAELLREALALFRGEPLADVDLALDLHAEVGSLEGRRLAAQEAQIAAELELGRHVEAIPALERLVAEHPLRESLRGHLILALYRAGRQADALRVAQEVRTVLASDLGIEPGPALQRLEQQVLDQDPALLPPTAMARAVPPSPGGLATFLAVFPPDGTEPGPTAQAGPDAWLSTWAHGAAAIPSRLGRVLAFPRGRDAAAAAVGMQRVARRSGLGLRIGLHSGMTREERDPVFAMRLARVAHPGQVVLSPSTRDLLREAPAHEVDVLDLGEHRLSDLGPRRSLYQLVAPGLGAAFPPIRGLDDLPTNLPTQATTLIDRAGEIEAITVLLRDPGTRLVTLTGPGGTGKTRLALHVAAELLDDDQRPTWFVPLDSLADPALVAPSIAAVLAAPSDGPSPVASIIRELGTRPTRLVLDNFEHLLPAAGVIQRLLAAAPDLSVLVTSRVPLKLGLERVVQVAPLPVPAPPPPAAGRTTEAVPEDVDALLTVPSIALFADRAAAARPGFALGREDVPAVAHLCRALDGLPLAIELAASRVSVMSPAAVLEGLDRPLRLVGARALPGSPRQRALDATIQWSHDLLDPEAQRVFAGIATFAGGWTLDGADAVCGGASDVVASLAELVDHSLVRAPGGDAAPRFRMFETIREYASRRLDASGWRREAEHRHATFHLGLAESAEPHLRGNPGQWLARLEEEHDNLRAALDRMARRRDTEAAHGGSGADAAELEARLAGSLWRFWYLAGHLAEGAARLEQAVAAYGEPTPIRVKALVGASVMAMNTGNPVRARERAGEAQQLAGTLGDAWSVAYARFMLGNAARNLDEPETARRDFELSLHAFRELGDAHSALLVTRGLAGTLEDLGARDAARALYQDALHGARVASNGRLEASLLGALATIAFDDGRVVDATLLLRESLRLHRELGDRLDTAIDLARVARTLAMGELPSAAARLLGCVSAIQDELGPRGRAIAAIADETRARLARRTPPSELDHLINEGASMRLDTAVGLALDALGGG